MNNDLETILKAITTTPGSGGDFLPQPIATRFIDFVRDNNFARDVFTNQPMDSKTLDIPKILSDASVYYENTETTAAVLAQFTTGSLRLIAKKLFAKMEISTEAIEDASFDMVGIIRDQAAKNTGQAEEEAMMVGDPNHLATALTPALGNEVDWYVKDHRLIFKGIFTLAAESGAGTTVEAGGADASSTILREALYNLGKFGRRFSDIVVFMNPWSANQMLDDSKVITLDKAGTRATIFTGTFFLLYGKINVINEVYAPDTQAVMTLRQNGIIGDRRLIRVERDKIIEQDMWRFVMSERIDFVVERKEALVLLDGMAAPASVS